MSKQEKENEIKQKYDKFVKTEAGQKWKEHWQTKICSNTCGDFGDYLYDFYPEMLT